MLLLQLLSLETNNSAIWLLWPDVALPGDLVLGQSLFLKKFNLMSKLSRRAVSCVKSIRRFPGYPEIWKANPNVLNSLG